MSGWTITIHYLRFNTFQNFSSPNHENSLWGRPSMTCMTCMSERSQAIKPALWASYGVPFVRLDKITSWSIGCAVSRSRATRATWLQECGHFGNNEWHQRNAASTFRIWGKCFHEWSNWKEKPLGCNANNLGLGVCWKSCFVASFINGGIIICL